MPVSYDRPRNILLPGRAKSQGQYTRRINRSSIFPENLKYTPMVRWHCAAPGAGRYLEHLGTGIARHSGGAQAKGGSPKSVNDHLHRDGVGGADCPCATAASTWIGRVRQFVAGGVFYTAGIIFYALDNRVRHAHGIWHLFVIAGSAAHSVALLRHVL